MIPWWSLLTKRYEIQDTRYKGVLVSLLRYLSFGLLALLAQTGASTAGPATDYQTKAAELEKLRTTIEALRTQLDEVHSQRDTLLAQLRDAERDIGALSLRLRERDAQLHVQNKKLSALQDAQRTRGAELAAQRGALAAQIRAAYITGRQEYLKILLNQQDPATVGRSLIYYDYFNRARARQIKTLNETLAELARLQQAVLTQTAAVEQLRATEQQEQRTLEQHQQTRNTLLAQLNSAIQDKDHALQTLLADERRLQELLPKLQRALAALGPGPGRRPDFARLKGKLPWPTSGPVVNAFGSPRMGGAMKWQGVLIGAPEGQDVTAVSQGRVVFADWLKGFGLLMIVEHGDGYMSLYGHNQSLTKRTGDWVEAGEVIASVGNSGGRASPGLYFEIRHQGEPADPLSWCGKSVASSQ